MRYSHNIPPVFDESSRVLVLGSFPSVKSREAEFFYAHPQNRFWRVLAAVFGARVPETDEEKRTLLLSNGVALWDVIASCEVEGSDDASINGVVPNDLGVITRRAKIERVFTNGGTAHRLYLKHCRSVTGIDDILLPSTSPANARFTLEKLIREWSQIR